MNHAPMNTNARRSALMIAILSASALGGISRHDRDLSYHQNLASEDRFQAAGAITRIGSGFASGTLIAPGWVLTAAHATEISTPAQLSFNINGERYTAAETFEHPLWQGTANITAGYDIALVRLTDPVLNIDPAEIYRGPSIIGREAMLVGAGLTGNGLTGQNPGTTGTLHAGLNTIDTSADQLTNIFPGTMFSSNGLVIDFDSPPPITQFNRTGSSTPLEYEFFPGQGDSGGAYWVEDTDGAWRLASIQSWGTLNFAGDNFGRYGGMAVSAALYEDTVLNWIDSIVPAPGTLCVFAPIGLAAVRRRRPVMIQS